MVKGRIELKGVLLNCDVTQTDKMDLSTQSGTSVLDSLYASLICFLSQRHILAFFLSLSVSLVVFKHIKTKTQPASCLNV